MEIATRRARMVVIIVGDASVTQGSLVMASVLVELIAERNSVSSMDDADSTPAVLNDVG